MEHRAKEENIPAWFMRQWIKTHEATRVEVMKCSERLCREMKRDRSCTEVRTSLLQEVALRNRVFRNAFGQQFSCVAVGLGGSKGCKHAGKQTNKKKMQSHSMKQQCQISLASNSFPGFREWRVFQPKSGSGRRDPDLALAALGWQVKARSSTISRVHWDLRLKTKEKMFVCISLGPSHICTCDLSKQRNHFDCEQLPSLSRFWQTSDGQNVASTATKNSARPIVPPAARRWIILPNVFPLERKKKKSNFCLHTQAKLGATLWKWRSLSFLGYIKLKTAQPARIRECAAQRLTCLFVHFLYKTTKTAPMITFIPTGWQIKLGYSRPSFGFSSRCLWQALEQKT